MRWSIRVWLGVLVGGGLAVFVLSSGGCSRVHSSPSKAKSGRAVNAYPPAQGIGAWTAWPQKKKRGASKKFWKHWGDGKAELSGFKGVTPRYGTLRKAEAVLVFVTEPMSRRTWIKNDYARESDRVDVIKLNFHLTFRTGIYPYSVLTSAFAPVDRWRKHAFSPAKMTLTAQEWCGHVFMGVWPGQGRFLTQMMSYFAGEGEKARTVMGKDLLYEDALLIQLRELDGPFNGGKDWSGKLVPTIWWQRRKHSPLRPIQATIKRSTPKVNGKTITRFQIRYSGISYSRSIDISQSWPHRLLGWSTSEGEKMQVAKTARLPYWNLNGSGDGAYRKKLGL